MSEKEVEIGSKWYSVNSKNNNLWEIWATDNDSISLMADTNGMGKIVPKDKFLKNWRKHNNKKSLSTINDMRKELEELLDVDILDMQDINSYIDKDNSRFVVEFYKVWEDEYSFPQYKHFVTEYDNFLMFEDCKIELNIVNTVTRDKDGFINNTDDILVERDKSKKIEDLITATEEVLVKPFENEKEFKKVIFKNGDTALFVKHWENANTLKLLYDNNIKRKNDTDILYSSKNDINYYGSIYDYDKSMKVFKDFLDDNVFMGAKLIINSEEQSKRIQKAIIERGGGWNIASKKIQYTNKKYLFVNKNLGITFGDEELKESYMSSIYPEMSEDEFMEKIPKIDLCTVPEVDTDNNKDTNKSTRKMR